MSICYENYEIKPWEQDHTFSTKSSTTSDLTEASDSHIVETSVDSESPHGRESPTPRKRNEIEENLTINTSSRQRERYRLSLDGDTSHPSHNLSTRSQPNTLCSLENAPRESCNPHTPNAAGSSYFQSEAYKKRRQKRLVALKNVRSTFNDIMDKSTSTNHTEQSSTTTASSPLALTAQIKAIEMEQKREKEKIKPSLARQAESLDSSSSEYQIVPPPPPPPLPPPTSVAPSKLISNFAKKTIQEENNNSSAHHSKIHLQKELDSANALIEVQSQQIQDLKKSLSCGLGGTHSAFLNSISTFNIFTSHLDPRQELTKVQRQLVQIQVNRAWEEWKWRQRTSENARLYQHRLSQYEKEIQEWEMRFQDAEVENQRQVDTWKQSTKNIQDQLVQAQLEIARLVVKHRVTAQECEYLKARLSEVKTTRVNYHENVVVDDEPTDNSNILNRERASRKIDTESFAEGRKAQTRVKTTGHAPLYERSREMIRSKCRHPKPTLQEQASVTKAIRTSNLDSSSASTKRSLSQRRFTWRKFGTR